MQRLAQLEPRRPRGAESGSRVDERLGRVAASITSGVPGRARRAATVARKRPGAAPSRGRGCGETRPAARPASRSTPSSPCSSRSSGRDVEQRQPVGDRLDRAPIPSSSQQSRSAAARTATGSGGCSASEGHSAKASVERMPVAHAGGLGGGVDLADAAARALEGRQPGRRADQPSAAAGRGHDEREAGDVDADQHGSKGRSRSELVFASGRQGYANTCSHARPRVWRVAHGCAEIAP